MVSLNGIDTREDHRFNILKSGDSLRTGVGYGGDCVTHLYVCRVLDTRADVAYVARLYFAALHHFEFEHANLVGIVLAARVEELYMVALAYRAVHHAEVGDNATEGVEYRVEDKGLQRGIIIALGCGYALDDSLQHLLYALTRLSRGEQNLFLLAADKVDNLVLYLVNHRRLAIYLVEYGDYFKVLTQSEI